MLPLSPRENGALPIRPAGFERALKESAMKEATTVAIIGAGPAGLAVGACLSKAGLDFVILEKEHQVGSSWRRHYARLHPHTVKQYSASPFLPFQI